MYKINSEHTKLLSDTQTPVSVYLKLRDKFPNSILLESSDYHSNENSFSYICCDSIASIVVEDQVVRTRYPDGKSEKQNIDNSLSAVQAVEQFRQSFEHEESDFKFVTNGLFGYINFEAVQYFEDIKFKDKTSGSIKHTPALQYAFYRYVVVFHHFKNELYIFQHNVDGEEQSDGRSEIQSLIENRNFASFSFQTEGEVTSNVTDDEYMAIVREGIKHCKRGDVFQIVLSREFQRKFKGDEFNVYRALRAVILHHIYSTLTMAVLSYLVLLLKLKSLLRMTTLGYTL